MIRDDLIGDESDVAAWKRSRWLADNAVDSWLGIASVNWGGLYATPEVLGALTPQVARITLTRTALMRKAERQKRQRGGVSGLLAAINGAGNRRKTQEKRT